MKLLFITSIVIIVFVIFSLFKNTPVEIDRKFISCSLYVSQKSVNPKARTPQLICKLNSGQLVLVNDFIKTGTARKMGYVLSKYYLELVSEDGRVVVYGLLFEAGTLLIGIDITGGNALNTCVTSTHTVVYNRNTELSQRLLAEIKHIVESVDE